MANIRIIHKIITTNARARKRLAVRLMLFANASNRAKVNPINIIPKKNKSYRVIWSVYEFKQYFYSVLKFLTGFSSAAFSAWKPTVTNAINKDAAPVRINTQ